MNTCAMVYRGHVLSYGNEAQIDAAARTHLKSLPPGEVFTVEKLPDVSDADLFWGMGTSLLHVACKKMGQGHYAGIDPLSALNFR